MSTVTFLVLDGVDKGRVFRDLPVPVAIGREGGNGLRLSDERVSRSHARVQPEGGGVVLTDLGSANGTRVNGAAVRSVRLRAGDRVTVGRTTLLFGTTDEIAAVGGGDVPAAAGSAPTVRECQKLPAAAERTLH